MAIVLDKTDIENKINKLYNKDDDYVKNQNEHLTKEYKNFRIILFVISFIILVIQAAIIYSTHNSRVGVSITVQIIVLTFGLFGYSYILESIYFNIKKNKLSKVQGTVIGMISILENTKSKEDDKILYISNFEVIKVGDEIMQSSCMKDKNKIKIGETKEIYDYFGIKRLKEEIFTVRNLILSILCVIIQIITLLASCA